MGQSNNKRIAKNTIFLYIRMLFTVGVALYTSRVVLETLGVVDYGIYNVIGGVVAMFGFLTNTMATASQRFLAFDIGTKNIENLKRTFSVTFVIYLFFAVIILLTGETIGIWFIKNKLTIPPDRLEATIIIYHLSLVSFIIVIMRIPYNAVIIAYEKMGFYAWSSIVEVGLKLIIVFALVYFKYDKLILYCTLMLIVVFIISLLYLLYCLIHFKETKIKFCWDSKLFNSMFGFAGWSLFDGLANIGKNEGVNILINIFFNPAINAARGIAFQVSSQIIGFVTNFQMAASPQLTKYYASNDYEGLKKLYYQSSRLSYYLLLIISVPVIIEVELLLTIWLKNVPEYTILFTRLILVNRLIDCLTGTTNSVVQATGNIKYYQIISGVIMLLNLPVSFMFLSVGYPPESTLVVSISISIVLLLVRLYITQRIIGLNFKDYLYGIVFKNLLITLIAVVIPVILYTQMDVGYTRFLLTTASSIVSTVFVIYAIGLLDKEKNLIISFINNHFRKYLSK
ncbi:MATE family efflux transporter [Labilibacter marinus]|uniref:MATE family efflux transporter n=1 Tax=Labilibacter marinus TaxID=1477105 RepID=UPI00082C3FFE|nr:MATE family efflux transporter [Labilibacter marinus]